jgi:hypothetical protein
MSKSPHQAAMQQYWWHIAAAAALWDLKIHNHLEPCELLERLAALLLGWTRVHTGFLATSRLVVRDRRHQHVSVVQQCNASGLLTSFNGDSTAGLHAWLTHRLTAAWQMSLTSGLQAKLASQLMLGTRTRTATAASCTSGKSAVP